MRGLVLLGAFSMIGCAAAFGKPVTPAPRDVTSTVAAVADTAVVRFGCAVPQNTTCRWAATVAGVPVTGFADGLEARVALVAPAPGDSVQVVASARAVRRGLVSTQAATKAVWVKRADVAPVAPDSVLVIQVTVPPVTN